MCAPFDSKPPVAPIAGASITHRREVLNAADGARFAAFAAFPRISGDGCGVVVLPDVRGLFPFYEELALRFAERGHPTVAIDYFASTAGVGTRDGDFPFSEHIPLTQPDQIQLDVGAAAEYLRAPIGAGCGRGATVGFCFGGRSARS